MPIEPLLAGFLDAEGSVFVVAAGESWPSLELQLVAIEQHPASPGAPRPQPFTLAFAGPADLRLPQHTFRLSHATLGELEIFLVPSGPGADGRHRYEAVFN